MCDPLGKNILLLIWFTKDFEGESSTCWGFFFWVHGTYKGRIFCILTGDILGKNLFLPYWGFALVYLGPLGRNILPLPKV